MKRSRLDLSCLPSGFMVSKPDLGRVDRLPALRMRTRSLLSILLYLLSALLTNWHQKSLSISVAHSHQVHPGPVCLSLSRARRTVFYLQDLTDEDAGPGQARTALRVRRSSFLGLQHILRTKRKTGLGFTLGCTLFYYVFFLLQKTLHIKWSHCLTLSPLRLSVSSRLPRHISFWIFTRRSCWALRGWKDGQFTVTVDTFKTCQDWSLLTVGGTPGET